MKEEFLKAIEKLKGIAENVENEGIKVPLESVIDDFELIKTHLDRIKNDFDSALDKLKDVIY